MKRIIILTAAVLLIFAGCTQSETNIRESTVFSGSTELSSEDITLQSAESNTEYTEASSVQAADTTVTPPPSSAVSTVENLSEVKPDFTQTTAVISQTATQSPTTLPTTAAQTTQKSTQASTTAQLQTENSGLNAVTPTTSKPDQATTQDKKITVTVFCSCKNAVIYGIRNKDNYGSFIPESGTLIDIAVSVAPDSTAMDAIKAACKQSEIEIDESRGYIKGIGGLYEKDCGGASGWLYSVNGSFPYTSSDKYVLKANDRIELHYTVKNGDVTRM